VAELECEFLDAFDRGVIRARNTTALRDRAECGTYEVARTTVSASRRRETCVDIATPVAKSHSARPHLLNRAVFTTAEKISSKEKRAHTGHEEGHQRPISACECPPRDSRKNYGSERSWMCIVLLHRTPLSKRVTSPTQAERASPKVDS